MKKSRRTIKGLGLALLLVGVIVSLLSMEAVATPHPGQSANVVIIGGTALDTGPCAGSGPEANNMGATFGGCLPVNGSAGELGDFNFTAMHPSSVSAANLAPFDTAVLNVASVAMACNTSTLTAAQRAALVAFVGSGKKLIIFDSECFPGPVDYSWMPFPFTTANPGALGAFGTLTIVEENTLSSNNVSNPHFINATILGSSTDAVGDMNVMTTFDPNWCVDMSGTNAIGVTGPVHTYAKYPGGTDFGLFVYNGLDQNFQGFGINDPWLRKIWTQELQQPFNPSNLPCGVTVVGIALAPSNATNDVGQSHTVTATLKDLLGNPQVGILVNFSVFSGPNSPLNGSNTTNASGMASFTYTGTGGAGMDNIRACFTNLTGSVICSQVVTKEWVAIAKGSISGMKFNDLDGDVMKDMGEPGLKNWTITLTNESGMVTNITDASGNYSFTDLPDGNYTVGEILKPGWIQTAPMTGTYMVEIKGGNSVTDKDFGNMRMPPEAACIESVNPSGKKVPPAGSTTLPGPKGGQNEDGFYMLLGFDILDPSPMVFVKDTGSGTIFGAFANGTNIKYTQDPDAMPEQKTIGGPNSAVAWHIIGTGDAAVFAMNAAGVNSTEVSCLVPPPPK